MALIKKTELKQMDNKKVDDKLIELNKEMIKIRSQISSGTLPQNPGGVKEIRRTIAKLLHKKAEQKKKTLGEVRKNV